MKFNILFTLITSNVIFESESAKILGVFPSLSISHQAVFRPVMHELAKRGHEVVVITPIPTSSADRPDKNFMEIDVRDVADEFWNKSVSIPKGKASDIHAQVMTSVKFLNEIFEAQVLSANVQKLINDKNTKFDLMFYESCVRPAVSLSFLYNVPVIEFSSFGGMYDTFDGIGATSHRLFYPLFSRQRTYNLTLWEKVSELYTHFSIEYSFRQLQVLENEMLKKVFGPHIPDLSELQKNVHMVFLNVHSIWDFNRPVPPNVIYLGGLHQNPEKELPEEFKSYLDASKNGVIYMSFGSNYQPTLLSEELVEKFINVFSQLDYDVLWKWDKEELPERSKNIRFSKWFPQSDLLKHPKIKLFITQGGLQSMDEALTAGVPLIAFPVYTDQWFNVEHFVTHGIGIQLSIETVTEKILKEAIDTIIGDNSYRKNVVKLRNRMRDQQQSSLERAVWWTEYVLRHGGARHLRSAGADIHWTEYYMIDIVFLLLTVSLAALLVVIYLIRIVFLQYKQMHFKVKTR